MLIALVGASGCCMYRSATFAVTNSTGKDVRLSYVLARDCNALGSKVFMPRLVAADRVEAGGSAPVEAFADGGFGPEMMRIEAGDRFRSARRASVLEPTGCPLDR